MNPHRIPEKRINKKSMQGGVSKRKLIAIVLVMIVFLPLCGLAAGGDWIWNYLRKRKQIYGREILVRRRLSGRGSPHTVAGKRGLQLLLRRSLRRELKGGHSARCLQSNICFREFIISQMPWASALP